MLDVLWQLSLRWNSSPMWGTLCFPITLGVLVLFVSLGIPNLKIKFLILVSDIRHCWWWSKTLNLKAALLLQWYLGRIRLLPRDWCCHLAPSTRNTECSAMNSPTLKHKLNKLSMNKQSKKQAEILWHRIAKHPFHNTGSIKMNSRKHVSSDFWLPLVTGVLANSLSL